jgi:SWI/SNF-related matrix-associated actin-dependent regulator of chromatin subfamily A-like protein 1
MKSKIVDIQLLEDYLLITSIPKTFILCISDIILDKYESSSYDNYEIIVKSNVKYHQLRKFVINLKYRASKDFRVRGMPFKIFDYLHLMKNKQFFDNNIDLDLIPMKTKKALFNYQKMGIKKCIENKGKLFQADEMGLGKTVQTISTICYFNKKNNLKKILIVVPSFLRENWRNELHQWSDFEENEIQVFYKTKQELNIENKIFIISYDLLNRKMEDFKVIKDEIDFVVVDESHYLKNMKSKRFTSVKAIIKNVKHCMLLTGTPIVNRPNELFAQLNLLKPDVFTDYYEFCDRYCNGHKGAFGYDDNGSSCQRELNYFLNNLMVRRLKKDVLTELPEKHRATVNVESKNIKILSEINKNILRIKQLSKELSLIEEDANSKQKYDFFVRNKLISDTVRLTCAAKLQVSVEHLLHQVFSSCKKCIYFCYHKQMLNSLEETCLKKNIQYIRIDGDTKQEDRQSMVNEFKSNDSSIQIAILSIKACCAGLNFTPVSHMVFTELTYEVATMLQCEDRIHRIGAKNDCLYEYLICKDTLDDTIYSKINNKFNIISTIVDNGMNNYKFQPNKKLKLNQNKTNF